MAKSYTIHSHKGGTGKTMFAMNMAVHLVLKGKRVAVIDLDLNAPSMQTYAPNRSELTINDMFLNNADAEDVIFDATHLVGHNVPGKLFMGLANISGDAISQIGHRSKDDLLKDLYVLMGLIRNKLPEDPWNADYILVDTPPGLSTISINGVAATEQLILLLKIVNADIDGTRHFLKTIHKALRPNTHLIVNQVPKAFLDSEGKAKTEELLRKRIIDPVRRTNIQYSGAIQTNEMLINRELEYALKSFDEGIEGLPRPIHLLDKENIDFHESFESVVDNVLK